MPVGTVASSYFIVTWPGDDIYGSNPVAQIVRRNEPISVNVEGLLVRSSLDGESAIDPFFARFADLEMSVQRLL